MSDSSIQGYLDNRPFDSEVMDSSPELTEHARFVVTAWVERVLPLSATGTVGAQPDCPPTRGCSMARDCLSTLGGDVPH